MAKFINNPFLVAHAERAQIEPVLADKVVTRARQLRDADGIPTYKEIKARLADEFPTIEFSLRDIGSWSDGPLPVYVILARGRRNGFKWMTALERNPMRRRSGL